MKIIYFTCSGDDEALLISRSLIDEKLAACINFFQIKSVYPWEGKIEETGETAVVVKTSDDKREGAIKKIRSLHSYKLPSISSWEAEETEEYSAWIKDVTS